MRDFRRGGMYALFFVSGAAGLVYQVAWSRLLNEIFGVTAHAVTAVLATFLGGLALGSWMLGRAADRCRDPLRLYALLELGVAATALAGTAAVRALDPVHLWAASRLAPDSVALLLVRAGLAAVVVLPPTVLMGGTLPAITRALVRRIGHLGRELSFVYALNTAGAVAGSVAAGFALIRAGCTGRSGPPPPPTWRWGSARWRSLARAAGPGRRRRPPRRRRVRPRRRRVPRPGPAGSSPSWRSPASRRSRWR